MFVNELSTTRNEYNNDLEDQSLLALISVLNCLSIYWLWLTIPISHIDTFALSIQIPYFVITLFQRRGFKDGFKISIGDIGDGLCMTVMILIRLTALYYCGPFAVVLLMELPDLLPHQIAKHILSCNKENITVIIASFGAIGLLFLGNGHFSDFSLFGSYFWFVKPSQICLFALFASLPLRNRSSKKNSTIPSFICLISIISLMFMRFAHTIHTGGTFNVSIGQVTLPGLFYCSMHFLNKYITKKTAPKVQTSRSILIRWGTSCISVIILAFAFSYQENIVNIYNILAFILLSYILLQTTKQTRLFETNVNSSTYSVNYLSIGSSKSGNLSFLSIKSIIKQIASQQKSRRIGIFLLINLLFTFVELAYGVWTNSLSLLSDGFHMLFDCGALFMGLYASVISQSFLSKPSSHSNKSCARVEILSGFVNGLFLIVISLVIMTEAVARLFHPPTINTDRLLAVSVGGLVVNLVGVFAFHDHHCASHCDHQNDENMRGVFLHVLADTLGSVGVIISTLATEYMGWIIADPLCSLVISALIFMSVIPLLQDTSRVLLLQNTEATAQSLDKIKQEILAIEGVLSSPLPVILIWPHLSSSNHANVQVTIDDSHCELKITSQIKYILKQYHISDSTIQTCKICYYQYLSQLTLR